MKKIPPFIILTLFSIGAVSISAQEATKHIARDGDKLHPGLSLPTNLILNINDSTRTVLLDPDAVTFKETLDAAAYLDCDTISYVQAATKHRFIFRNDTLSYLGFENRATDYFLDSAVNVAHFPLKDGGSIHDIWSGQILHHGSMLLKRMTGKSSSHTEEGWVITDGIDTIPEAMRLTWTLDMAYAAPDSITPELPDSINSERISEMQVDVNAVLSERLLTERSIWFADDARYPVLTDTRISRLILDDDGIPSDTIPISMIAMYYPGTYQNADTGEDITGLKPYGMPQDSSHKSPGAERGLSHSLTVEEPEANGNIVTVSLSSQAGLADVTVTLFSESGIRLTEPLNVTVGNVPQTHSFEVPADWNGVLLLRVDAGEESYTKKIIR